jgi:hypothetical protein
LALPLFWVFLSCWAVKFDRFHFVYLLILFSMVFCLEYQPWTEFFSVSLGILSLWFPVSKFKIWYCRDIGFPLLVVFEPCTTDYLYFGKTRAFPYQVIPDRGCGQASSRLFSIWIVCKFQSLCFFHIHAITLYGKVLLLPMVKYIFYK